MTDPIHSGDLPDPVIRRRSRIAPSLIWLVPVVAVLAGIVLIVRAYHSAGPDITIKFNTADGLERGKTEVRFKNVVIGQVRGIQLSEDHQNVVVEVSLTREAENIAVEDTRFWVVRPRADLSGFSGLTTLLSGAYIGVDPGTSTDSKTEFNGLEVPPAVTNDQTGRRFQLTSEDLGSVSIGSPVYFRRIPVGRVTGYQLAADGGSVGIQVFIDAPYDRYVTNDTHFWNASGVDVSLDAGGFKLSTQSLISMLTGGIAFTAFDAKDKKEVQAAAPDSAFKLYADEKTALAPPDSSVLAVKLRFAGSVRGLTVNAPVDFKGIELGKVTAIGLEFDPKIRRFVSSVSAELYPERLGDSYQRFRAAEGRGNQPPEAIIARMVSRGMRAQLRSGNLLTGQLFVALEFVPDAPKVEADPKQRPLEIPTMPGSLDQIQTQIAHIVEKLDKVPIEDIGNNLRDTLKAADKLMTTLDKEVAPEARDTLAKVRETLDSLNNAIGSSDGGGPDLRGTLQETERAARSLRTLGDYLQRHPEALLRGKADTDDPDPPKQSPPWNTP